MKGYFSVMNIEEVVNYGKANLGWAGDIAHKFAELLPKYGNVVYNGMWVERWAMAEIIDEIEFRHVAANTVSHMLNNGFTSWDVLTDTYNHFKNK